MRRRLCPQPKIEATRESQRVLEGLKHPHAERRRIGVCGELYGGSLAAMLALTECRRFSAVSIGAVALGNPVTDWTALFPEGQTSYEPTLLASKALNSRASKPKRVKNIPHQVPSQSVFIEHRQLLFRRWPDFFDPFASPLLFLQSPSIEIPTAASSGQTEKDPPQLLSRLKTHYNRPFISAASNLLLPAFKITLGMDSPLKQQGLDLVKQLRRNERLETEEPTEPTDTRIDCEVRPGHALWTEQDVTQMGEWFGHTLRDHNQEAL